jgi:PHD/YefM family antitoxin component YafN of YafNO toxin-antitoxin module
LRSPQIIRTPHGEELVVLPRADYEALVERADHEAEDAEDVAIYDARKAELAAGGGILPPG